jgi:hypothetical protein
MQTPEYYLRKAEECIEMARSAEDALQRRLLKALEREFREKAAAAGASDGVHGGGGQGDRGRADEAGGGGAEGDAEDGSRPIAG